MFFTCNTKIDFTFVIYLSTNSKTHSESNPGASKQNCNYYL